MDIPDPVANYGDTVFVHNYRSKPSDGSETWEEGIVSGLSYQNAFGRFHWRYTVQLTRQSAAGNTVLLYVNGDQINNPTTN